MSSGGVSGHPGASGTHRPMYGGPRRAFRRGKRAVLKLAMGAIVRPRLSLLVSTLVLAGSASLALSRLSISTDQNRLFSSNVKFFHDWLVFDEKFPENQSLYFVVEPKTPGAIIPLSRWTGVADAIAAELRKIPQYAKVVDERIPLDKLGRQGILFDDPADLKRELDEARELLPLARLWGERSSVITSALGSSPMERFITALRLRQADEQTAQFADLLASSWTQAVQRPDVRMEAGHGVPDLKTVDATPRTLGYYYLSNEDPNDSNRHVLLIRVAPRDDFSKLTAVSETVDAIRNAAHEGARGFPEFTIGATGRPALDADEMKQTDRDSRKAEIAAGIAVFIGLVVMLRSIWLALAAEIALGYGIGWTFGWATLTLGELNLLSIVFLIALIGIGMDYLVQILSRYRHERQRHARPTVIWAAVFRYVGPPINTACLGAACAFLVSALTDFRGAAELGIIAGGGLLLCLLSGYTVLPALLTIYPGAQPPLPAGPRVPRFKRAAFIGRRFGGSWLLGPVVWVALLLIGSVFFAPRTHFDPGLLNLQSPNARSVQLIKKLQTWSGAVISRDLSILRAVRGAVQPLPVVQSTESILDAFDNQQFLHDPASALPAIRWTPPAPVTPDQLPAIAGKARSLAEHFQARPAAAEALTAFASALTASKPEAKPAIADRLSLWQTAFVDELRDLLGQFDPPPLELRSLPRQIRSHYVSDDGYVALYIYPRNDLWKQENLEAFVQQVESRVEQIPGAPNVTGIASNIYHSTASIQSAFLKATVYALGLILMLVMLDLRRPGLTLLAVSVLALGLPMLVSLMGLLHVDWNFANFFGLPILIGAGHEYGVFLVHRYLEARRDQRRAWNGWDVSDRALLLCAYVTSSSFGFFWAFSSHRGLKSLGLVMALGTACIYLSALLVLRPFLRWKLERHAAPSPPGPAARPVFND